MTDRPMPDTTPALAAFLGTTPEHAASILDNRAQALPSADQMAALDLIQQGIIERKDAEIAQLRRDVAGQTRSAQNGWRTADAMRAAAKAAEAKVAAVEALSARYVVSIHQQNAPSNKVTVEVFANHAAEAIRKAKAYAPDIHSPIVKITSIVEGAAAPTVSSWPEVQP